MTFHSERAAAIRNALIETAIAPARPRRRALTTISLMAAGAVIGAGGSAAAFVATGTWGPEPASTAAPGAPVITVVGEPSSQNISSPTEVSLADHPAEATHVRATLTCLTPGVFSWGIDPGDNDPRLVCEEKDLSAPAPASWQDVPLDGAQPLAVRPGPGARAILTLQYLSYVPTHPGVNDDGETFGINDGEGTPDLVLVIGTAPDGQPVQGYVRAADLAAFSPDHPRQPADPEEALAWQREREEKYPGGWEIPVLDSDGVTELGTFHIGP